MDDDLAQLTERTIDSAIRAFDFRDENSYSNWDGELHRVEALLIAAPAIPRHPHLLASIRAQRIRLAFQTKKFERVLELSALTLSESPPDDPDLATVVIYRARSLHALCMHTEEIGEVLATARTYNADDGEFIYLLLHLAKNHPGSIPQERDLLDKLRATIAALRADLYESLPDVSSESEIEETVLRVAKEMQRVSREMTEAILRENS
jgi:hypothetical protein